jgi:kojibiose phosphorylase
MDQRPGDDYPSLLGVMGPDEYTPIAHNNAYTNWMVRHALRLAYDVACRGHGNATAHERHGFVEAAESLPIPRRGDLILQCEDWDLLSDPYFKKLWLDRTRPFAAQVPQERLYRSKCLKQADVILLQVLFPHEFTDAECRAAWDEYLPFTTHDSSLSKSIHAIMAVRLGLHAQAWDFWTESAGLDLDVAHGGAAEGMHIACCAGNWQVAVFGFAGMRTAMQADVLTLAPHLPAQWTRLAFPLVWKGTPCRVEMVQGECRVTNLGSKPLAVSVAGQEAKVPAGATMAFDAEGGAKHRERHWFSPRRPKSK